MTLVLPDDLCLAELKELAGERVAAIEEEGLQVGGGEQQVKESGDREKLRVVTFNSIPYLSSGTVTLSTF